MDHPGTRRGTLLTTRTHTLAAAHPRQPPVRPPSHPPSSLPRLWLAAHAHTQSAFARASQSSRTALALSLVSGGTLAWYSALYGNPLFGEVKAESAADHGLHPPAYPWAHKGVFETFDHSA